MLADFCKLYHLCYGHQLWMLVGSKFLVINHLRNIIRIRKYISQVIRVVLFKSLVMSRLDYSNGLL